MLQWLKCFFGFHEWSQSRELTREEAIGQPAWKASCDPPPQGELALTARNSRCGTQERLVFILTEGPGSTSGGGANGQPEKRLRQRIR